MLENAKPRILIVDDEPQTLRSLNLSLRSRGYQSDSAVKVSDAMQMLQSEPQFDMLLTDYSMPDLNGVQFLRTIRAKKINLPVIMMTAYGHKDVLVDALRNQCNGFIEKPFTIEGLIAEIERVQRHTRSTTGVASQKVGELVHQMNSPLTIIMGSAQLVLLQSADDDPKRKTLEMILDASKKIHQVNREIFNLGKDFSDGLEILDVHQLLIDLLISFKSVSEFQNISTEYCLEEGPVFVEGHRFALEQMFGNLITNAIEAMQDCDTEELRVCVKKNSATTAVDIFISDNGCGMSGKVTQQIFKPYYTTKKSGTGLGLALVRRVITTHRGSITVDSKSDVGTTFVVTLPLQNVNTNRSESEVTQI